MKKLSLIFSFLLVATTLFADDRLRGINVPPDLEADEIPILADWGVNLVRLQVSTAVADSGTEEEFVEALDDILDNLDTLLPILEENGIQLLLVLHTPPGGFITRTPVSQFRMFVDSDFRAAYLRVWERIANRYLGDSRIYAYELLSEPHTGTRKLSQTWQDIAVETANAVLAIESTRRLVITPDYADVNKLIRFGRKIRRRLGRSTYRSRVSHNVHIFKPANYVNQRIDNNKVVNYPSKQAGRGQLVKTFRTVRRAKRRTRVDILIGEFSVVRWAPNAPRYLRDFVRLAERSKVNWAYHIFRESDVWDLEVVDDIDSRDKSETDTERLTTLRGFWERNSQ